ncbi:MAG: glycosyltransferase [Desulfobacterales bacterium]|nr:glycosyltransferase [Desulfobacterales bacterium]
MSTAKKYPMVSVIIPTYNRAGMLEDALTSVLAQDFTDYELIVVDDGSTDDTQDILNRYAGEITCIQQHNQGVSAARNRGMALASGRYTAFLDSDDLWLPGKLSCQVKFFQSNPTALICQTEEIWVRNGVRVNPKKRHKKLSGAIYEPSLDLCLVSPSAVMAHRDLFKMVGGFDEKLPACEDYDLWLRVSSRCPVYLIDTPLLIKRGGHPGQLSGAAGLDKYRIAALKKIIESHQLTPGQYAATVNKLREKCSIYAAGCRKRGRDQEARYHTDLGAMY